jgi:hypothetical protein
MVFSGREDLLATAGKAICLHGGDVSAEKPIRRSILLICCTERFARLHAALIFAERCWYVRPFKAHPEPFPDGNGARRCRITGKDTVRVEFRQVRTRKLDFYGNEP